MTRINALIGGAIFWIAVAGNAGAQTVRGRVVDERGAAVVRAEVQVLPSSIPVLTDAAGNFTVGDVTPGLDSIRVRRVGFTMAIERFLVPVTAPRLTIVLHHAAAMLDTMHTLAIEQRLPRMFDRMQNHLGAALYGPALDSMFARGGSRSLADMLAIDKRFAMVVKRPHSGLLCVFVDGIDIQGPIEEYVREDEISAMEVFSSTDFVHEPFPFEHLDPNTGKRLTCGRLVLVWSKYYQQPPWAGH